MYSSFNNIELIFKLSLYCSISKFQKMYLSQEPRLIENLSLGCRVSDFKLHGSQPLLLITSTEHKIESLYLNYSNKLTAACKSLPMKSYHTSAIPHLFDFYGKQNIIYCQDSQLIINQKTTISHKSEINNLMIDNYSIALTSCEDNIFINSLQKRSQLGQLHYYGGHIQTLFWHNSLVISGDQNGLINLWDINKQQILNKHTLYSSKIDIIGSYVDFIHTNFYYTVCKQEKRMAFHDLRTYKPIKILNNLSNSIIDVKNNQTGKVFLRCQNNIEVLDAYKGYDIMGKFCQINEENIEDFLLKHPQSKSQHRQLKDMIIVDKYVLVGCSNGCVEVYNSDTLECQYAFGICQFSGVKKLQHSNHCIIGLSQKGLMSIAKFS